MEALGLDGWMAPLGDGLLTGLRALPAAVGRQALYATLLFLVLAPLCAVLVRRWPHRAAPLRAALWTLVLLRLVLPPDLSMPWSAGTWAGTWIESWVDGRGETSLGWLAEPEPPLPAFPGGTAARSDGSQGLSALPWGSLLALLLWGTGALSVSALFLLRRRGFHDLVDGGETVRDAAVLDLAEGWRRRLRIRRSVRLVTADSPVAPFTCGSLWPVVFVPASLLGAERRQDGSLEAVIAHELAHVARWDDLRLLILRVVQGLWFFHPVAWWAGARLLEERERLCDARVLACGEMSPQDYGRSLLTVVRMNLRGTVPWLAPGFPKGRIAMRIREIVRDGNHRPRVLPALLVAVALGLFLLPLAPTSTALEPGARETGDGVADGVSEGESVATTAGAVGAVGVGSSRGAGVAEGTGSSTGAGSAMGVGLAVARGSWSHPVPQAKLTSPFGQRVHPMTGEWVLHRGLDLAAPTGKPILAPAAGVVTVATQRYEGGERHGTVVVIDHGDGLQSFYSHLDSLSVTVGQHVAPRQILGTVGATGDVTGPHLHFEVWQNGAVVDPALLIPAPDGC